MSRALTMLISPKKHYHCCKKKHREHTQSYLLFASIIKQVKCGHFLSFGLGLVLNLGTLLGVRKILISDFFQTITLSLINMSVPVEGERSYKNCNIRLSIYCFASQSKRQQLTPVIVKGLQLFLASNRPSVQV